MNHSKAMKTSGAGQERNHPSLVDAKGVPDTLGREESEFKQHVLGDGSGMKAETKPAYDYRIQ